MKNKHLTTETLKSSLKKALKSYWLKPENRKIDGRIDSELLENIEIIDVDYYTPLYGNLIGQLERLLEAYYNNDKDLPALHGHLQAQKITDHGNATHMIDCDFELFGNEYHIDDNGKIYIKNLLVHIRN